MYFRDTKKQSVELYSYDNITLKLYTQIASGSSVKNLIIKGNPDSNQLAVAWEQIVKQNSQNNGTYQYNSYFQLLQTYELLVNEYNTIKAMLTKLSLKIDHDLIKELRRKGYNINATVNSEVYATSLLNAGRKVENLVTKIKSKQTELNQMEAQDDRKSSLGFEELLANLSVGLGFNVDDSVTLARFNEFQKLLKKKMKNGGNK